MTKTVVVWRHGQTDYNVARRFQGQSDIALNAVGLEQAERATVALAELHPDIIVSSDLLRAAATADQLAERVGLTVSRDARLRETSFGDWEGLTRDEIARTWPDELHAWISGADTRPPRGETRTESGHRVARAITDIVTGTDAESIVIVAHGAVLRAASEELLGMTGTGRLAVLGNCGHSEFGFTGDTWVLRHWGTAAV
ncbi:histidine phosphatase family protein [Burkholderia multivorans]|nr:histidine phosphatase family protein [Burkholderia multivorans]